jgi:ABC-type branched-subunit amino acid transport system ATPase component/ABC-type branched-subunit amino acid transport system permease subunit
VSTLVWVMAGVLSAITAVLLNPVRGTIVGAPDAALGPGLLLRALTAAMLGGLVSLPLALVGGVAVGIVEAVMFANVSDPGAVDLVLFLVVLALVFGRRAMRTHEDAPWSLSPRVRPIPSDLRDIGWVRRLPVLTAVGGVAVAAVLPLVFTSSARAYLFSTMLIFALVGLSVTVLTGWAGQLSLGQFAFVGLGAMVCGALHERGMPFAVAVAYATAAGVLAALLIGFPALRARGLYLAVTTLAFAVAARSWIFVQDVFLGDGTIMYLPRGEALGVDFRSQRAYYYLCLVMVTLAAIGVATLRASGVGRSIIATRENESAAASFTISPALAKLTAFGLSGGLAALAGALLAGLRVQFGADAFGPEQSLQVVAMTIIGGLGSVGGPILGALYVVGLPALFDDSPTVALATSGIGLLVLLLYLPGGLMQIVYAARDALFARTRSRRSSEHQAVRAVRERRLPARPEGRSSRPTDVPALAVRDLTVRFGGRLALDDVTIVAHRSEVIGLIGANGAGKSTFLNVAGGFVPAERGRIEVFGVDVTDLPAHRRARHGVGRVFQDARLFGDLTVTETVEVALEAGERSELVPSLLRLPPARRAERAKASAAAAYVDFLGLGRYADRRLGELSTGTRRIVELCCLLAQGADLLLLDEPTAGVAQRESEAFGPLIRRVQAELGATILVVEHDMPLVLSISDRVYCLSAGAVIADGRPEEVRVDPLVISTYLGTDDRAILRSGAAVSR